MNQASNRKNRLFLILPIILLGLSMTQSCSVTRTIPEGRQLLNNVVIKNHEADMKSELRNLARQKENNRILWVYRFKLRFYNLFIFKKDGTSKLRLNIGEPPILYDSVLAAQSIGQMQAYLKNKGFFSNKVSFEAKLNHNEKKVKLIYHVEENEPTLISSITYALHSEDINNILEADRNHSVVSVNDRFDSDKLEEERKRMEKLLLNDSYFFFTSDLIYFKADTLKEKKKADITILLKTDPLKYFSDTIRIDPYKTYKIGNIIVRQNFDNVPESISKQDTAVESGYRFLNEETFTIRPKVISRSIFLKSNDYYRLSEHENTYRRLSGLNNYKYINISYVKSTSKDTTKLFDCMINLVPSKPRSFGIETNGTSTGGNLGINGSFSVQNRNTFRGAEILRLRISGGLEAQSVKSSDEVVENTPFNTVEFGPELSLVFPQFLLPVDQNKFAKRYIPKTTVSLSYNFQQRPDYTRNIVNAALIYSWRETRTKSHALEPINISQTQIDKTPEFQATLDELDNSSLTASYENNFIPALVYSFVYNDQLVQQQTKYTIFRTNIELAGNLIYMLDKNVFNSTTDENGQYRLNGIPYSQYTRVYNEFIHSFMLNKLNSFVSRTFVGVGYPYQNSQSLPFTKSFYGGGTNGIRAWQARRIGPGSVPNEITDSAKVDQIGDIKLEQNIEYRFKIIKFLEAAVFVDAGNIWVFEKPGYDERAIFSVSNIWRDLAIGAGVGARLNFNFFVVRLDVGKRVKDPGAADPNAVKFFYPNPPIYNFAIGYPF